MSSAILYLAIIAIWAGVLIPRWLKRDTSHAPEQPEAVTGSQPAGTGQDAHGEGADEDMAKSDAFEEVRPAETATPWTGEPAGGADARADEPAGRAGARADEPAGRDEPREDRLGSRARMLAARRRMLIVLCTLTAVALGIAVTGLAAWWVAVPPIVMLAGYMMLLREVRRADAEHALLEAAAYRDEQRRSARTLGRPAARAEGQPPASASVQAESARIIDISERVRDELYDQYADGERRAVGD